MIKKILLTLYIIGISTFLLSQQSYAETPITDIGSARYYVESIKDSNYLTGGVYHHTDISKTSAAAGEVTDMGMGVNESFVPDKFYDQQVSVLEVPSSTDILITPWAHIENNAWSLQTVGTIAKHFEANNPGYKVVAGVNGDFYDIEGSWMFPWVPNNVHASRGEHYKTMSTKTAVGFTNDGSTNTLIGHVDFTRAVKPTLTIYDETGQIEKEYVINHVNQSASEGEVSVHYPKMAVTAQGQRPKFSSINVENAYIIRGGMTIPETKVYAVYGNTSDDGGFYGKGVIDSFGSATLGNGDFAIESHNEEISNYLESGKTVRVQYEFDGAFKDVDDVIGVGQTVLHDGLKVGNTKSRAPRTMVGMKADGTILLTVIDGRQPQKLMYGASQAEMAATLKHYGAIDGYNLDGGGSSAMFIRQDDEFVLVNSYSDSRERAVANAVIVAVKVPVIETEVSNITDTSFTLNAHISDLNGIDLDTLYVGIDSNIKPVVDGVAIFEDLTKSTNYTYQYYYKEDETYIPFHTYGAVTTAKVLPEFKHIRLTYEGQNLIVEAHVIDIDQIMSNFWITINGIKQQIVGGYAVFPNMKSEFITNIEISYGYDARNTSGYTNVLLEDIKILPSLEVLMSMSIQLFNNDFNNILITDDAL